jgi:hypothetical protein
MITQAQRQKLLAFGKALVNQEAAHVLVEPMKRDAGFWFGGGNLVEAANGDLYLTGRYRNYGDSRTGLDAGARGLELNVLVSHDRGKSFSKVITLSKADLNLPEMPVLSIEGSALHVTDAGVELFVSSEKDGRPYPDDLQAFQKPGTGIWTIDRIQADTVAGLAHAEVQPLLASHDPRFLHVKDPVRYTQQDGELLLGFCTHPFNWSSSNSAYAVRVETGTATKPTAFSTPTYDFFRRGFTWDVAISRITALLRVPRVGAFAGGPALVLAFYDGGESMRNYDEHVQAVKRPRGYSCEELGGLAVAPEDDLGAIERLSVNAPAFVSPWGTGCSRYVDVLETEEGFYATWQQSQADLSQPLVMNFVSREKAQSLLS